MQTDVLIEALRFLRREELSRLELTSRHLRDAIQLQTTPHELMDSLVIDGVFGRALLSNFGPALARADQDVNARQATHYTPVNLHEHLPPPLLRPCVRARESHISERGLAEHGHRLRQLRHCWRGKSVYFRATSSHGVSDSLLREFFAGAGQLCFIYLAEVWEGRMCRELRACNTVHFGLRGTRIDDANALAEWLFQVPPAWSEVNHRCMKLASSHDTATVSTVVDRVKELFLGERRTSARIPFVLDLVGGDYAAQARPESLMNTSTQEVLEIGVEPRPGTGGDKRVRVERRPIQADAIRSRCNECR